MSASGTLILFVGDFLRRGNGGLAFLARRGDLEVSARTVCQCLTFVVNLISPGSSWLFRGVYSILRWSATVCDVSSTGCDGL